MSNQSSVMTTVAATVPQHTQGPWQVIEEQPRSRPWRVKVWGPQGKEQPCIAELTLPGANLRVDEAPIDRARANAALIAATPALYDALAWIVAFMDEHEEWTRAHTPAEAETALQACGVPAHAVLDTPGLFACPQLQHRGHFVEIAHDIYGTTTIESSRLCLSRAPARVPERALGFGRDNRHVLESILGYPPERIAELAARGVLR